MWRLAEAARQFDFTQGEGQDIFILNTQSGCTATIRLPSAWPSLHCPPILVDFRSPAGAQLAQDKLLQMQTEAKTSNLSLLALLNAISLLVV